MNRRALIAAGGTVVTGGLLLAGYGWLFGDVRTFKSIQPDDAAHETPPDTSPAQGAAIPARTGYRLVDALLPALKALSARAGIPLGLLVAWIAKESGGKLTSHTSLDERGYFQLMPAESKGLGLEHQRLSSDSDYSLQAGASLVGKYAAQADALGVAAAPHGSAFYWLLVKMIHTVGLGQTKKWIKGATAADAIGSWGAFESYVLGEHWAGPQPKKWLPFLDEIYKLGRPFGFGSEPNGALVAGYLRRRSAMLGLDVFSGGSA